MDGEKPDLIVGVDFGMTCTGVSYANLSIRSNIVKWIQKWPGRSNGNEDKVPTVLVYPTNRIHPKPCSWGFLSETAAEQNADDKDYKDWFKTYLDPIRLRNKQVDDPEDAPGSIEDVERWYEDYLKLLYRHIEFKLSPELSRTAWHNAGVEFIFSVPTTWKPMTVEKFRAIAERAGFGRAWNHTLSIGLTEAEAAAVHTSIEASGIFNEGDILLVCDAGGGTTDLSVLKVTDTSTDSLSLQQLDVVFGATIGSAAIDYDFERLVRTRLEQADRAEKLNLLCEETAWEMMKSRDFQNTKCEHGGPDDTPAFFVSVPRINSEYVNHVVGIANGEMKFSRGELQSLFNKQIQELIKLIDVQLNSMQQKFPNDQVAHLVLSGGLGHSPYVQEQLKSHYILGASHPNARSMQVRIAPDPQLAVCKGLVADRVCKLKAGKSILKWRRCRASYGTLCRELYDRNNPQHIGRVTVKDPMSGKMYVTQSVAWFIKKGEPVSGDQAIIREFTRKIAPGDPRRAFPTSIVVSHIDTNLLHSHMSPDTQILCDVKSDLSSIDETNFKEKNQRFWTRGKRYYQVDYQVKVLFGPADIRFELYFNGQKINKDQPIQVEWLPASAPEPSKPIANDDGVVKVHTSPKSCGIPNV